MRNEMRKYFSVFGLYARGSIFKVLGLLLGMSHYDCEPVVEDTYHVSWQ